MSSTTPTAQQEEQLAGEEVCGHGGGGVQPPFANAARFRSTVPAPPPSAFYTPITHSSSSAAPGMILCLYFLS